MRLLLAGILLSGCCVDCAGGDLHGSRSMTADGGTLLIAGPFDWKCAAKIDGAAVTQGVPMVVKPGKHVVACDHESIEVHVAAGTTVKVDYFGP